MKILITGGSGYIGVLLADQLARRNDIESLFLIDKDPFPKILENHPQKNKIRFIQANLANESWQDEIQKFSPNAIVHTAWNIREIYGQKELLWKWNVEASNKVFDLAFSLPSLKTLIHFSSAASYGAFSENTLDHFYKEEESLRRSNYSYAEQKRIVEENLKEKFLKAKNNNEDIMVFVLRPASITGPFGRLGRLRFGLQSALGGKLKGQSFLYEIISWWVSFVPVTPKWARQYVHEDDVVDAVTAIIFEKPKENLNKNEIQIFNLSPGGKIVDGKDMSKAVKKKRILVYPWMVRISFFVVWHLTAGRIPTSKGVWQGYSYPILIDGSKITKMYDFNYKCQSFEAFADDSKGHYANLL